MGSRAFLALVLLAGCSSCGGGDKQLPAVTPPVVHDGGAAMLDAGAAPDAAAHTEGFLDATPGSLDALFGSLAAAERGEVGTGRSLWLFFGDSHTAGDSLTERLRTTLAARFGDGGRGFVAAGRPPTKHYYQRDVKYGATNGWKAAVGGKKGDSEPFGMLGLRVFGSQKGAQLWVETCESCTVGKRVAQFELFYYAAPDHGGLRYRVDEGPWIPLSTKTQPIEPPHPARQVIGVPDGPHKLLLEHTGGGPVDLFGVALERLAPGTIVDSLGVVGRRLGSLRSWDWSVIGDQLATRDPKLVVLQYGTNEADDPDLDLEALARYYDETILRIRAAAPTASILILGPPDMGVREAGAKACERLHKTPDAVVIPECEWRTPHVLLDIISVEHAAAVRNRVAFFDTFAAMGGADKMNAWFLGDPRAAYKDRVHFTDLGYQWWADALSGAILRDYDGWRAAHGMPRASVPQMPPPPAPPGAAPLPLPGPVPVEP
ncbi:MAG TPA: GDSL-type esterase/lipase family protein [Kofleriaceae bacterium]|jgi:lysophospholipase L1-like esterase